MTSEAKSKPVERLKYADNQHLRREDFEEEQTYHVTMRRRHNLTGHSWGIADGLAVEVELGVVTVERGYAVDGFGRELVVVSPLRTAIAPGAGERYVNDVWLCYGRKPAANPCYWVEEPRLLVTEANPDRPPNPDEPPELQDCDREFGPHRPAPEDARCPVFLARVTTKKTGEAVVDIAHRRYVGVRAARVEHPDGNVALLLHDTVEGSRGFAVEEALFGGQRRLLTVDEDKVAAPHRLEVGGELRVGSAGLRFTAASPQGAPGHATIYRSEESGYRDLRITLPDGGKLVIGAWSAERQEFAPCLTVSADRTVTVDGTLVVKGALQGYTPDGGGPADRPGLSTAIATVLAARPELLADVVTALDQMFSGAPEELRLRTRQNES